MSLFFFGFQLKIFQIFIHLPNTTRISDSILSGLASDSSFSVIKATRVGSSSPIISCNFFCTHGVIRLVIRSDVRLLQCIGYAKSGPLSVGILSIRALKHFIMNKIYKKNTKWKNFQVKKTGYLDSFAFFLLILYFLRFFDFTFSGSVFSRVCFLFLFLEDGSNFPRSSRVSAFTHECRLKSGRVRGGRGRASQAVRWEALIFMNTGLQIGITS